jgi:hypothetical protein
MAVLRLIFEVSRSIVTYGWPCVNGAVVRYYNIRGFLR